MLKFADIPLLLLALLPDEGFGYDDTGVDLESFFDHEEDFEATAFALKTNTNATSELRQWIETNFDLPQSGDRGTTSV